MHYAFGHFCRDRKAIAQGLRQHCTSIITKQIQQIGSHLPLVHKQSFCPPLSVDRAFRNTWFASQRSLCEPPWVYRRIKHSKDESDDEETIHPCLSG